MERSNRSLQISYRNWINSLALPDEVKGQIKEIFFNEDLRKELSNDEIFNKITSIEIGSCQICGCTLTVDQTKCPYSNAGKLPANSTENHLKHYNYWYENLCEGQKNKVITEAITENAIKNCKSINAKNGLKWCDKCQAFTNHVAGGTKCMSCYNKSELMREASSKRQIDQWKDAEYAEKITKNLIHIYGVDQKFCNICSKITDHIGSRCREHNPWTTGFHVLFNKECKCKAHPDSELNYFNKNTKECTCWECYKESFVVESSNQNDFIASIISIYNNAIVVPTFRNQDSNDWSGARKAFEQSLSDLGVSWFTYVKFYINNHNDIKPIVVGKSGSQEVIGKSDINFSLEKDTPARLFIKENDCDWDKTKILLIPCDTEDEALMIEKDISERFNLFMS